jgi:hypothetical protein
VRFGEGFVAGLQRAVFSLCLHERREGEQAPDVSPSKGTNPIMRAPTM